MELLVLVGSLAALAALKGQGAQGQQAPQCPFGWQTWTDYCYLFVNTTKLTWQNANKDCRDKQSHLLRIETLDEYTYIRKGLMLFPSDDYWSALNNLGGIGATANASNRFMWGDDEYPSNAVVTNNWDHEPNNNDILDCVMMNVQVTLSVGDCNERHAYICQMQPSGTTGCPSPWKMADGADSCYFISNATDWGQMVNWEEARKTCESMGTSGNSAYMVKITTPDVQNYLLEFLPNAYYGRQQFWTGLNDQKVEGTFQWSDGTAYTASNFAGAWRQEPNNLAGAEHCVALLPGGKWNDAGCTDTKNYICRKALPSANSMAMNLGCGSWTRSGRSCVYIVNNPPLNWNDARTFCQANGGDLIKFDSKTDADWMTMQAVNGYALKGTNAGFWIGLNDLKVPNTFVWIDGSEPQGDILIWTQEPNRLVNYGPNCASLASSGQFLDEDCDTDYAIAACEEPTMNGGCGSNWLSHNNRCYFFDGNNWKQGKTEALNRCKAVAQTSNPTLLTLETVDEYNWVVSSLPGGTNGGKMFWTTLTSTGGMDWIWDGVFQDPKITQQIVQWDSEPNNWGGSEACVEVIQAGTLNDASCGNLNGFICQKYLDLPPITTLSLLPVTPLSLLPVTTLNPGGSTAVLPGNSGVTFPHHGPAFVLAAVATVLGKMLL